LHAGEAVRAEPAFGREQKGQHAARRNGSIPSDSLMNTMPAAVNSSSGTRRPCSSSLLPP